jgi:hypothetical protein
VFYDKNYQNSSYCDPMVSKGDSPSNVPSQGCSLGSDGHSSSFESSVTKLVREIRKSSVDMVP